MMKITLVTALFLSGCIPTQPVDDRLNVTTTLRMACPGYTDPEIEMLISAIESDRLVGTPYAYEIQTIVAGCEAQNCVCLVAVTDQVYEVRE